jgi:hypothetical protein
MSRIAARAMLTDLRRVGRLRALENLRDIAGRQTHGGKGARAV